MLDEGRLRRELVRIGRLLYDRRLVVATEGNLSARLGSHRFLVTPAGVCKGWLEPEDLLITTASTGAGPAERARRLSSEWPLHREIYRARADVAAVCHAHPPYATAWATRGRFLPGNLLTDIAAALGEIPVAQFAVPSAEDIATAVKPLTEANDAVLLAGHGVVTVGADPAEAYLKLETVERLAHVAFLAASVDDD